MAVTNPHFPERVQAAAGGSVSLSDAPQSTETKGARIVTADGSDLVVRPGQGFTARVRLESGEDQLWRPGS